MNEDAYYNQLLKKYEDAKAMTSDQERWFESRYQVALYDRAMKHAIDGLDDGMDDLLEVKDILKDLLSFDYYMDSDSESVGDLMHIYGRARALQHKLVEINKSKRMVKDEAEEIANKEVFGE